MINNYLRSKISWKHILTVQNIELCALKLGALIIMFQCFNVYSVMYDAGNIPQC